MSETLTTYKMANGEPVFGEYEFVIGTEWFDDVDEPTDVVKEVWVRQSVETITHYPPGYPPIRDHAWVGIADHPDDWECSVCGEEEDDHAESTR